MRLRRKRQRLRHHSHRPCLGPGKAKSAQTLRRTTRQAPTVTELSTPAYASSPMGITSVPGGNLWFTEFGASQVGTVTTSGAFTEYPTPTANAGPTEIALGADGNLWTPEYFGNNIARITPAGVVTKFALPTPNAGP